MSWPKLMGRIGPWLAGAALAAALSPACLDEDGPAQPSAQRIERAVSADDTTVDARLLLLSATGAEPALAAMRAELDRIGTPYKAVATSSTPLSAGMLSDGQGHGAFNGVVVASCGAGASADAATTAMLSDYAVRFGVRSVCLRGAPDGTLGLGAPSSLDTRSTPLMLTYTPAGVTVFGGYAAMAPLVVSGGTATVAPVADSAATTALLVDAGGNAAAVIHRSADGAEQLALTFDQAAGALHTRQLLPGLVAWVSRGVYVGEKRAYLGAQVDDVFLGTVTRSGPVYRMSAADLQGLAAWQQGVQSIPVTHGVRLTFAFNGVEVNDSDQLTQAAKVVGQEFDWVSHTFDHHRLDSADYPRMTMELTSNDAVMKKYAFGPYDRASLVTPDISAIGNAAVLRAAADFGIQQLVCDGSQSNCRGEIPNTGLANPLVPALLMVPRIANDLYANVSTPAEWVGYFNALNAARLGRALAIDEILDAESDILLGYLLDGDIDPWMFHQANLRLYDGSHALLTDLLDRTLAKYTKLRVLPILSLPMNETGQRMQERAQREAAAVTATIHAWRSIVVHAGAAARVPVTGARGPGAESYGGLVITRVDVPAGGDVALPLAAVDDTPDGGTDGGAEAGAGPAPDAGMGGRGNGHSSGGCAVGGRTSRAGVDLWLAGAFGLALALRRRWTRRPDSRRR
jgi:hypothetical protein